MYGETQAPILQQPDLVGSSSSTDCYDQPRKAGRIVSYQPSTAGTSISVDLRPHRCLRKIS